MKTSIKSLTKSIANMYGRVKVISYFVEDEQEVFQRILIHGSFLSNDNYFVLSIVGCECDEDDIKRNIKVTSDEYKALYWFRCRV